METGTTEKVSIMNAVLIWLLTNVSGTAIMVMLSIISGKNNIDVFLIAGLVGTVITLPAIGIVFAILYGLVRIKGLAERIVLLIFSMIGIALLLGLTLSSLFGEIALHHAGNMIALFSPWIISAIGITMLIERKMIFRKQANKIEG